MVAFLSNTQGLFELANMFSSSSKNADGNNDVDRMGMEMGDRCFGELGQSCLHALSTCYGPDVCDIRTSHIRLRYGEEPHELGTSILSRVTDRTTSPVPAGIAIPHASLEEIVVTRPDHNVVTKADYAAKRKTSTGPEISTNTAKRTRLSQKVFRAGSSGLAAGDGVEQTGDGTLDDDVQRDGPKFAMEDIGNLNDVSQGVSKDASSPAQEAVPAPDTQPLDTNVGADEIASDGNVDPYYEARVSNTAEDCQLVTHGSVLNARYDHSLKNVERFMKRCTQQTHIIKKQGTDLKQQKESTAHANEEVSRLTADMWVLKSRFQTVEHKLTSWDKKHIKYRNERDTLSTEKAKIEEELVGTKSQLEHRKKAKI
ncbi:hypothetical protein Tco_0227229 [Tanacetum coccineum]